MGIRGDSGKTAMFAYTGAGGAAKTMAHYDEQLRLAGYRRLNVIESEEGFQSEWRSDHADVVVAVDAGSAGNDKANTLIQIRYIN